MAALFLLAGMICSLQADRLPGDDISRYAGQVVTLRGRVDAPPQVLQLAAETVQIKYTVIVTQVQPEGAALTKVSGTSRG